MGWYDAAWDNDPSPDNPFGREPLAGRPNAMLVEFLRRGGALGDFAGLNAERQARDRLMAAMDRALNSRK